MAEMEEALKGTEPFGMRFVRSHCTRVSTSVFQMVKHLNELAPDKYEALYVKFKEIQGKINPYLVSKRSLKEGPLVLPLQEIDKNFADQVGGKIANLGEIKNRLNITVPSGFVVTAGGYHRFIDYNELQPEINRRIQAADIGRLDQVYNLSASIQQLIIQSSLPEDMEDAMSEHFHRLEKEEGEGVRLAVRSSGLGEDLLHTSFAGQYRSELNVSPENMLQAYKEIVASKYSLQAIAYRLNRGIRDEDVAMCVGYLRMVNAVSGGVLYSRNPIDIRDESIVINSVWGLPKSVVDGSTDPDTFILSRQEVPTVKKKEIAEKHLEFVCYPDEGVCRLDSTGDKVLSASLTDDQAVSLAQLAMQLEGFYGVPQDIEWGIDPDGSIVLLQCRPLRQIDVPSENIENNNMDSTRESPILSGGIIASPGTATGRVYVVRKDADVLRFPRGAVLVAEQSLPRWASLLNRAAAVVTEHGSVAGHLATMAREFRVPAIFGLKGAVQRLGEFGMITVDADGKRIYEGDIEGKLKPAEKRKNLLEGSPVHEALTNVARLIIPLNLLNPDAPAFRPENCKTFHDITRFCHEKSVHEMFQFGKDHHFPERSSKQLVCEMPMQWWVLNLDDGFQEEVEGRHVPLDNIVSIPMLALWEGITAVPWGGPPAVDGKGMMSIMFEATANPSLVTGVRSKYGNRNYFMISKNYCSLNSRLGFHFSSVETLVGERSVENYISFQFKGGAADSQRRYKRTLFISDILDEYGFRINLNEDHLTARLENHEKAVMITKLKIIGYLTIHTRQLDMIMSNEGSVNYYKSKLTNDINTIISSEPAR